MQALEAYERQDIKVVVGGVIPQKDYALLKAQGVVGIYGPGTKTSVAAQELLLDLLDC